MSDEQLEARVRAIALEVMTGAKAVNEDGAGNWSVATVHGAPDVSVSPRADGHHAVSVELLDEDTGQLMPLPLATTRGEVLRPVRAAKHGLLARAEELARRLGVLDARPEGAEDSVEARVEAIAREVLKGAGVDVAVNLDDEGHWKVETELLHMPSLWELHHQVLATTRGDVPMPRLVEKLGLTVQVEELARRLGTLGFQPEEAPLDEEQAEAFNGAVEDLRLELNLGAHSLAEILSIGGGLHWPYLDDDDVIRRVLKAFVQDVQKRLADEKDWPEVIEADRLEAAFEDLRAAGIIAKMGATDTLSGGWTLMQELATDQRDRGLSPWGAVFFHDQDTEHALEGGPLHLAFGELTDEEERDDEKDVAVGRAVVEALRTHGFEPEWNGSAGTRITLLPAFPWRRRRMHVDTTEEVYPQFLPGELVELFPRLRILRLRGDDLTPYELSRMRSNSVEELTVKYDDEAKARDALPDIVERAKGRFPRLKSVTVASGTYEETEYLT
ncbi:hypothetical protein JY651_16700 [Pyxidicoccus parkwayensis]|uniref:DUF6891 domain-containing protein n=1 Tax=Pyxidicoccus parkwayensis TaxID=2813578 RepID=A0ABX7P7P9_9BACT|nr:hypothetical protein [Pyxidicoccus parkwaysis]QSQ26466.1 hypothetical protein JY651_16700 [Pyxidicoccus parkwaysis]